MGEVEGELRPLILVSSFRKRSQIHTTLLAVHRSLDRSYKCL